MLPYVYCQTTLSKSSIKHPGQVTIKMKDMTKMLICSIPLAAPSATRAAAASHGTSDAFVIQMHFMSCLKGVFEMLMAFHQQWWMDILPIMDKLASATYPLHTYYLQFYLLLRILWVGIL